MVDILVEDVIAPALNTGPNLWGPYWSDNNTGIIVYADFNNDVVYARTTDGGLTWAEVTLEANSWTIISCWYDKETNGNTGTLVHVAWIDDGPDDLKYVAIDVAAGSVGTIRIVDNAITVDINRSLQRLSVTKTRGGNILIAFSTQTEIGMYRSVNDGVNWTARADVYETATEEDWVLLFPGAGADNQDAAAVFWDRSADEITLKIYDDSADSWAEFGTLIAATAVDSEVYLWMDGAVRHSDDHVLLGWHSSGDTAGDDLQTAELTVGDSPAVTAKTNVFTNQEESGQVAILIDQLTDAVYLAHIKGGTWLSSTSAVVFHVSTDGMLNWGSEEEYSETTRSYAQISSGHSVGSAGGHFQPAMHNIAGPRAIHVNLVNQSLNLPSGATKKAILLISS